MLIKIDRHKRKFKFIPPCGSQLTIFNATMAFQLSWWPPMAGCFRMTILGTTVPIGVYEFRGCEYDVSKIIGK